jgi:hypothetical protein
MMKHNKLETLSIKNNPEITTKLEEGGKELNTQQDGGSLGSDCILVKLINTQLF